MLEQLTLDTRLLAAELGVAAWAYFKERFTLDEVTDRFGPDGKDWLDYLLTHQYIVQDGKEYLFRGEGKKKRSALEQEFEEFRLLYTGVKPGEEEALKILKKHKDWKQVIPLLRPAFEKEELWRKDGISKGEFRPPPKHLQTWLNQRCWQQEFGHIVEKEPESESFKLYRQRVQELVGELPYLLSENQMAEWMTETGVFAGLSHKFSHQRRKEMFYKAHIALRDTPETVRKDGGLYTYLIKLTKD